MDVRQCFIRVFLINRININKDILKILCPDKKLLIISVILLIIIVPDLLIDKFDLHPGWTNLDGSRLNGYQYFYDMISFNFIRLSELQEFVFACYSRIKRKKLSGLKYLKDWSYIIKSRMER